VSSNIPEEVERIHDMIKSKFDEIKVKRGHEMTYLGMLLKVNRGTISITMTEYIRQMIKEYPKELRERVSPTRDDLFHDDADTKESFHGQPCEEDTKLFHRMAAKLLYLAKRARPDISLATHYLCTKTRNPSFRDIEKLEHLLGYLMATISRARIIDSSEFKRLQVYVDAAFSAHLDGKSQTGCIVYAGNTPTDVITRKQKCATRDSTEAELVGLADMLLEIEWHQEWWMSQGYDLKTPIVYQDNKSTITLVENGQGKFRNKHLRALQGVVHETMNSKEIEVKYVRTDEMIADLFTKHLAGKKFYKFANQVLKGIENIPKSSSTPATRQECVEQSEATMYHHAPDVNFRVERARMTSAKLYNQAMH
jgi:hypothetical protein